MDSQGKVIPLRADAHQHPDLFRACRGAGGGNFGVITSYEFDKLPKAPLEVMEESPQKRILRWRGWRAVTICCRKSR